MISDRETILVAGYPKSGNTWLARLTAEMLDCPVAGYLGQPWNDEIAAEGAERTAKYVVFKGHHTYAQAAESVPLHRIVYIVRDVRDIAVSGAHYFFFPPRNPLLRLLYEKSPEFAKWRIRKYLLDPIGRSTKEMIHTLSQGNALVGGCKTPWDQHVQGYLDANAFIVRYEDLLTRPYEECTRIAQHLGVDLAPTTIQRAIENQSFNAVKEKFSAQGDRRRATFLRSGRSGEWKTQLTGAQVSYLQDRFRDTLHKLGYDA